MTKELLLQHIRLMIETLSRGVPADEVTQGWDAENVQHWKSFFERLYRRIESDESINVDDLNIARLMNHAGIGGASKLGDRGAQIWLDLREYIKEQ